MLAEEIQQTLQAGLDAGSAAGPAVGDDATLRERYRQTMFFQCPDRIPNFEFGYWDETLTSWHGQGLPPEVVDQRSAYRYFGIEDWVTAPIDVMGLRPAFTEEVLEESDTRVVYRGSEGEVAEINRHGHRSIPHFLRFPVESRADWERFRERLQPVAERVPDNWPQLAAAWRRRALPLAVPIGSLIGRPRNWVGFERIALLVYDDPAWLEDMVETCCQLVCATLERVLADVEFDFAFGWEDICFNSGPIVGTACMREIVAPRYRRITDLLRKHGCHIATTDCDGDVRPILDAFAAGGINCLFPVEVNAGCDPVALRRAHPDLLLHGGFDKMVLTAGPQAIRTELERLAPVVRAGGFLPGVDHRVQADVALDDYRCYLKLKRVILGVGGEPEYDERAIG